VVRARPEREDLARRRELAVGLLREAVAVEPLRIGEVLLVAVRGGEEDDDLLADGQLLAGELGGLARQPSQRVDRRVDPERLGRERRERDGVVPPVAAFSSSESGSPS